VAPVAADQRIERKDATLAFVIGLQGDDHIFECRLKEERPENCR
jgi:hypothetical protein